MGTGVVERRLARYARAGSSGNATPSGAFHGHHPRRRTVRDLSLDAPTRVSGDSFAGWERTPCARRWLGSSYVGKHF